MGKGAFHLLELAGQTSHFENEMGFYRESWLKNHPPRAYYLEFD